MGKHWKKQRKRPKKFKRYLNEDHLLKIMGRRSKRPRNAMTSGNDSNIFADGSSSDAEEKLVFNLGRDNTNDSENGSSDDEDLSMEEEAEAVRIQKEKAKFLSLEDFGLEEADESGSDSHAKEKKQKAVLDVRKNRERFNTEDFLGKTTLESFEEIKIDLNSLSREELMDAVYSSAPELVGLLSELSETWSQLEKLEPLVCEVKERKDGAKGKMHHLEVKRLLLLTYCQAMVFYLLLKSEGHPVQDHPVVGRLVEIKAMMEQMKQIEANIPSQVDKKIIQKVATKSTDKLVNQSEVTNVQTKTHESPVKASSHLVIDGSLKKKHNKHVNEKDQVFQGIGLQSREMLKERAELEAKLKQNGLYNVTNSKNESNRKNSSKPVNNTRLDTQDDFDDEVQPVENGGKQGINKISKLIPNKGNKPKMRQIRKHKALMARRAAPYGGEPGGIDPNLIRSIRLDRLG